LLYLLPLDGNQRLKAVNPLTAFVRHRLKYTTKNVKSKFYVFIQNSAVNLLFGIYDLYNCEIVKLLLRHHEIEIRGIQFMLYEAAVLSNLKWLWSKNDHSHCCFNQTYYYRKGGLIGDPPRPHIRP